MLQDAEKYILENVKQSEMQIKSSYQTTTKSQQIVYNFSSRSFNLQNYQIVDITTTETLLALYQVSSFTLNNSSTSNNYITLL